ncbi:MAG: hypothetical protein OEZ36_11195 [Spirochaetota bacterium]|nr:hypothetical protein [Spirochaetota bacterium]
MKKNLLSLLILLLMTISFCSSKSKYRSIDCSNQAKSFVSFKLANEKAMAKLPKSLLTGTGKCLGCLKPLLTEAELDNIKKILVKDQIYLSAKPSHSNIYSYQSFNQSGQKVISAGLILLNHVYLSTGDFIRVGLKTSKTGSGPIILLDLNVPGTNKMMDLTESNIGTRLAILLDDKVILAPVIMSRIRSKLHISLGVHASKEEAAKIYCGIHNGLKD